MQKTLKVTTDVIVGANNIIDKAELSKLTGEEKIAVVKILKAFRPFVKEYNEADELIKNKMKGENHDKMVEVYNDKNASDEDKKNAAEYLSEYISNVQKSEIDELKKDIELTITPLTDKQTEDLFGCLNDVSGSQMMELYDLLVEEKEEDKVEEHTEEKPEDAM